MRRKRFAAGVLLGACVLAFGGCSLGKEEGRPIFEIEDYAEQNYEMTKVARGTVRKTGVLTASYVQTVQEKLRFSISGKRLANVYTAEGRTVKKGDLLAELLLSEEEEQLADMEYSIRQKELQKKQYAEQLEFQKTALEKKKGSLTEEEYQDRQDEIRRDYEYPIEDLEDELEILRWQQELYTQAIEGGRLYAGMDGIVTKMSNIKGYVSDSEADFLVISDSTVCAFRGYSADLLPYFHVGEQYTFYTSDKLKEYTVTLVEIDESIGQLTFELPEPDYSIPIGLMVLHTATKEQKENTLYLPKAAVHEAGGRHYVYYIDAEGIRRMQEVTIGLVGDTEIEILSGLSEDDEVILH